MSEMRRMTPNEGEELPAEVIALLFLAVGIAVVWFGKQKLGIQGDTIYAVLLLVPILVYLALTGKLTKLSVGGASAEFVHQSISNLEKKVTGKVDEIGAYEAEKSAYFGKLQQVLSKAGNDFCLIYADVDSLRRRTRETYRTEKAKGARKTEKQIRSGIIEELGFALADAFAETDPGGAKKYDMFFLEEPDLVMIARAVDLEGTCRIATRGQELFQEHGYTATVAVGSPAQLTQEATPQMLHETLSKRLSKGQSLGRGKLYAGA